MARHIDKNSAAINKRHLDFIQTRGLISLISDDHVNNSLKESLVDVYYGLFVNNRPKNGFLAIVYLSAKWHELHIVIFARGVSFAEQFPFQRIPVAVITQCFSGLLVSACNMDLFHTVQQLINTLCI